MVRLPIADYQLPIAWGFPIGDGQLAMGDFWWPGDGRFGSLYNVGLIFER
jgi:hypothetical protein